MKNTVIVWHNPRCRKSREGLAMAQKIAEEKGLSVEIRKYLDNPPTKEELQKVLQILGMKPIELVRTKEAIWKEQFKGKDLSEDEILNAMVQYPKLIERPIVIYNNKAVLARPAEKVLDLFK
jgi:arsenate reductase